MKTCKLAFVSALFLGLVSACSHTPTQVQDPLTLDHLQSVQWSKINRSNAAAQLGTPTVVTLDPQTKNEVWVYKNPELRESRFFIIFSKTGQTASAQWVAHTREPNIHFQDFQQKHPEVQFDMKTAQEIPLRRGMPNLSYQSVHNDVKATVTQPAKFLTSVEWTGPNTETEKR